jgi:hypothetical protein
MSNTSENIPDFEAFLRDRGLTLTDYAALSEEKQQYLQETWHLEQHIMSDGVVKRPADPLPSSPSLSNQQQQAGLNQTVLWVFLGCFAILVLSLLIPGRIKTSGPSGGATDSSKSNPSFGQAPGVPAQSSTAAAPDWHEVGRIGGKGVQRVPEFTISGPKWRIVWATRPDVGQKPDDFIITVRRPNDETATPAAHVRGESEGETVLRGTGTCYLEIVSSQSYLVKVYDFR